MNKSFIYPVMSLAVFINGFGYCAVQAILVKLVIFTKSKASGFSVKYHARRATEPV